MKKLRILVVNGFSSGMMIVEEAKRLGYECYHLTTAMKGVPESYLKSNMAAGYDGILEHKDDFEEQLELCRAYNFDIVMPGTESGVILAERLASALSLNCNDTSLMMERRDKYLMQKRLEDLGIPGIRSQLVKSSEEAVDWFRSNNLSKAVMKPRMDAGGLGVHICESEDDIVQAFAELYGHKCVFGDDAGSPDVLIQEHVTGKEIAVNHVSHDGVHELTDIWFDTKHGTIYDYSELVNLLTEEYAEAVLYTNRVLDALGINYGPSHTEIVLTDRGPVLMETGARLMGELPSCESMRRLFGTSIIERAIHSYIYPVISSENVHPGYRLSDLKFFIINIRSYIEGKLADLPLEEILADSKYAVDARIAELKDKMVLKKTTNLADSPGSFGLLGADESKLREWMKLYAMIERKHPRILFTLENDAPLTEEEKELRKLLI